MNIKLTPQQNSELMKYKNVAKQLRIAKATQGSEKQGHLERADKLLTRYGK